MNGISALITKGTLELGFLSHFHPVRTERKDGHPRTRKQALIRQVAEFASTLILDFPAPEL